MQLPLQLPLHEPMQLPLHPIVGLVGSAFITSCGTANNAITGRTLVRHFLKNFLLDSNFSIEFHLDVFEQSPKHEYEQSPKHEFWQLLTQP